MHRHILDTGRTRSEAGRAAAYLKLEKQTGPHPASLRLQRLRKGRADQRLKHYLRVERGRTA